MARAVSQRQRSPLPATQSGEPRQTFILQPKLDSMNQEGTPSSQNLEPEQPTITDDDVRHRAYELYLL